MKNIVKVLLEEIDDEIKSLKKSPLSIGDFSRLAFEIYHKKAVVLRERFLALGISNQNEEIEFFKHLKPQIESQVIYHSRVFRLESSCSSLSKFEVEKLYRKELNKIRNYFKTNRDLVTYYKTENCIADQFYFVRSKSIHQVYQFDDMDFIYSTGYDKYFIKIRAFEQLMEYCRSKISTLENETETVPIEIFTGISWTASKTDLVELMYSLIACKCLNHGDIEVNKLATVFETIFQIDLKDFYRTYSDLKIRSNPTNFLEKCIDSLRYKMDSEL